MLEEKNEGYDLQTDEELVWIFQSASSQDVICEILQRFKSDIRNLCRAYFLPGAGNDDLLQEAYLGLFKAVRDYQPQKNVSFRVFAKLCIKRQIITAIKQSTRQKHLPLNRACSLDKPLYKDEASGRVLADVLPAPSVDYPETSYIMTETLQEVQQQLMMQFSGFEANIMALYMNGHTYAEMAQLLNVHEKAITNGMYRVQKKLKRMRREVGLADTLLGSSIEYWAI